MRTSAALVAAFLLAGIAVTGCGVKQSMDVRDVEWDQTCDTARTGEVLAIRSFEDGREGSAARNTDAAMGTSGASYVNRAIRQAFGGSGLFGSVVTGVTGDYRLSGRVEIFEVSDETFLGGALAMSTSASAKCRFRARLQDLNTGVTLWEGVCEASDSASGKGVYSWGPGVLPRLTKTAVRQLVENVADHTRERPVPESTIEAAVDSPQQQPQQQQQQQQTQTVVITPYQEAAGALAESRQSTGFLQLTSEPSPASVYLDEKLVATTPTESLPIPTGDHTLRVLASGHGAHEEAVLILSGVTLSLHVVLREVEAGQ